MNRTLVILVCRDAAWRRSLRRSCVSEGLEVLECEQRAQATEVASTREQAVIVFTSTNIAEAWEDVHFAGKLHRTKPRHPLVLVVTESSEELAVAAMRSGINDLFHRPETPHELVGALRRFTAGGGLAPDAGAHPIVGVSQSVQQLRAYLAQVAATDSNVLITGETGTGKELAAEVLHRSSARRDKKLIPVNCAAIPDTLVESELFGHERGAFTGAHAAREGKFQLADGGTVFLDEIGDMDLGAQAKLLRVIENKEVYTLGSRVGLRLNVRVVAATNQDPEQLMRENRFRKDLYFRLNVARIHMVPLRERKEDIPALVEQCLQELNRRFHSQVEGCSEEASRLLMRYDWPGNVRELKNLLEATLIGLDSPVIGPANFPPAFHARLQALEAAPNDERERLLSALSATKWNVSKAAEALQWSRMTLYRKIARYHLARK